MYCYKPPKQKENLKLFILLSVMFCLFTGAVLSRPSIHNVINHIHNPIIIHIDNGDTYNPCGLNSVACAGEEVNITRFTKDDEITTIIKLTFGDNWKLAYAVMMSESGGNPSAVNHNTDAVESIDYGLWQINNHWHPEISYACAVDIICSTEEAYRISNGGSDWSPWYGFVFGGYLKFLNN